MGTVAVLMLAGVGAIMITSQGDVVPQPESRPAVANRNHAANMTALKRPDTPAATSAPAPIVEPTKRGTGTPTGRTVGRTRSPRAPRERAELPARGPAMIEQFAAVRKEEPRQTNPMLPYRLTIMTSDDAREKRDPEKDIAGTRYIELTTQELKKLGIYRNRGVLELYGEERREITDWVRAGKLPGYDTSRTEAIVRFRATIDTNLADLGAVPNPTPDDYSSVAPIVIETQYVSSANMLYRAMIYFNRSPLLKGHGGGLSDEDMDLLGGFSRDGHDVAEITTSPSLNRLVAVHVIPDESQMRGDGGHMADVHLWYLPTREFIDLLPDRYRDALRREIATIAAVRRERLPLGTVCERLTGEPTFLDVCRTSSGALHDLTLAPNPAHEKITVSLRATEPRTVSISLHDGGLLPPPLGVRNVWCDRDPGLAALGLG